MIKQLNLTDGSLATSTPDPQVVRRFLGGLGLGNRLLADLADFTLPPLHPDLPVIIGVGCLTATGFPGANRVAVTGISPQTGLTSTSWMGGEFGTALAHSGTLSLVLQGRAPQPSIVVVTEQGVSVVPRPDLWGKTVPETQEALAHDYPDLKALVIGPAGERLVPMAAIRGNEAHSAGRCGPGAMLGSKNVKAVLAGGRAQPPVANREALREINRQALAAVRGDAFLNDIQGPIGTPNLVAPVNEFHAFPTGNHQERHFPTAHKIHGELIAKEYAYARSTCPGCPVRCRLHVRVAGQEWDAPEYESLWSFGGQNRCDDYGLICRAVTLCNDLGLDTISAGSTVAFYREYTGTMDDPSNIPDIVRMIAYREGDGDILARGTRAAAAHFGVDYAMQVKGLELAAYDPRKFTGMALSYATTNRGGCHSRAWTVGDELSGRDIPPEELADLVFRYANSGCARDSLIMCTFLVGATCAFYPAALSAILGETVTADDLTLMGERIYTQERMLNVLRGVDASQDTLPRRILDGMVAPVKFSAALAEYYRRRDWDSNGRPSDRKLAELGLDHLIGRN